MQRMIQRLRLAVLSAMCSLPSSSHLILLQHMSGLFVDSDSDEDAANSNFLPSVKELKATAHKIESSKQP